MKKTREKEEKIKEKEVKNVDENIVIESLNDDFNTKNNIVTNQDMQEDVVLKLKKEIRRFVIMSVIFLGLNAFIFIFLITGSKQLFNNQSSLPELDKNLIQKEYDKYKEQQ